MAKTSRSALWFTLEDDHTARWVEAGRAPRTGDLTALAAACAGAAPVVWLLDARTTSCHEVGLPPASARLQAQALPFALEDQILGDLETLALASVALGNDRHGVAVSHRELLSHAHAGLLVAGVAPTAIVPDALCLPWHEGEWSLLLDGRRGWLRCGQVLGFGFEAAEWRGFVLQAAASAPPPATLRVFGSMPADAAGLPFELLHEPGATDLLDCLARECSSTTPNPTPSRGRTSVRATDPAGRPVPDFAPLLGHLQARAGDGLSNRPWRWAAGLLVAGLVVHGAFLAWHAGRLELKVAAAQAANETLLRERFPEITRVVDVRAQATQALAARAARGAGEDSFLSQLAAVGPILAQTGGDAALAALDFERGAVELRLDLPDMATVDGLQRALGASSVQASTLSVETTERGARLALRLGAPQ